MVTLILFAVFNQINFFVGLVFGGIGLAVDIFLIKSLKSLLRKMGILKPAQENKPTDSKAPKENYMKKSPLSDVQLLVLGDCYNKKEEDEKLLDAFFLRYLGEMPELKALTEAGKTIDSFSFAVMLQDNVIRCFDKVFKGRIPQPEEEYINFIDEAVDIACGKLIAFLKKLNHSLYGKTALPVAYAVASGLVSPDEDWLYDEILFDATPETDPEGEKTFERIRPMLEAAGCPVENE